MTSLKVLNKENSLNRARLITTLVHIILILLAILPLLAMKPAKEVKIDAAPTVTNEYKTPSSTGKPIAALLNL